MIDKDRQLPMNEFSYDMERMIDMERVLHGEEPGPIDSSAWQKLLSLVPKEEIEKFIASKGMKA